MLSWRLGPRDAATAYDFMQDLAGRLANRVQLTTDGHRPLPVGRRGRVRRRRGLRDAREAIWVVGRKRNARQPGQVLRVHPAGRNPQSRSKHISTSCVERSNLTMRLSIRITRLTNGFSKELENHAATVALYFMYYNFARVHRTLKVTPAMESGISDHVWSIEEIVGRLDRMSAEGA